MLYALAQARQRLLSQLVQETSVSTVFKALGRDHVRDTLANNVWIQTAEIHRGELQIRNRPPGDPVPVSFISTCGAFESQQVCSVSTEHSRGYSQIQFCRMKSKQ